MPKPNNCIVSGHQRPSRDLLSRFAGIPVSNIGDVMGTLSCMAPRIHPFNNCPLLGPAFTVKVRAGDILILHKAITLAQPGDVIVVDGQGYTDVALTGELMTTFCRKKGLGGMVIDGSIRDAAAIRAYTDFPVYAVGVTPKGPLKVGGGEIGTPIACGGVCIHPGDILAGDDDGVVVISQQHAMAVADLAEANMERERGIMERLEKDGSWDRPWIDEKLKDTGCDGVDG